MDDGSSASLSGGSYGEITSGTGYVKSPTRCWRRGTLTKKGITKWVSNANITLSKVTVEGEAPFEVERSIRITIRITPKTRRLRRTEHHADCGDQGRNEGYQPAVAAI